MLTLIVRTQEEMYKHSSMLYLLCIANVALVCFSTPLKRYRCSVFVLYPSFWIPAERIWLLYGLLIHSDSPYVYYCPNLCSLWPVVLCLSFSNLVLCFSFSNLVFFFSLVSSSVNQICCEASSRFYEPAIVCTLGRRFA